MVVPELTVRRLGEWLPWNKRRLSSWINGRLKQTKGPNEAPDELAPVIQDFKNLIESDPVIWMGFHEMFEQVPHKSPYHRNPANKPQVQCSQIILI